MTIRTNKAEILPITTTISALTTVIQPPARQKEPAIFSKAWEWDELCNHCVD